MSFIHKSMVFVDPLSPNYHELILKYTRKEYDMLCAHHAPIASSKYFCHDFASFISKLLSVPGVLKSLRKLS